MGDSNGVLTPNQATAKAIAKGGLRIFPCHEIDRIVRGELVKAKSPMTHGENWQEFASVSIAPWDDAPTALVGLPVVDGGLVIDCDRKPNKPDGVKAFHDLCTANGIDLSNAFIVETPSGGLHFYWLTDEPFGNSRGSLPDGIDVRGGGKGYVIAPGSTLPDGRAYKIVQGSWDNVPTLPEPIAVMLRSKTPTVTHTIVSTEGESTQQATEREKKYGNAVLKKTLSELAIVKEGERNNKLNTLSYNIGRQVGAGRIDAAIAMDSLLRMALSIGLGESEAKKTIQSGINAGYKKAAEPLDEIESDLENELFLESKFVERYGDSLRYTAAWNKWHIWDGITWRVDEKRKVFDYSKKIVADCHIPKTSKNAVVAAVVTLANSDEKIAASAAQWDANPYLTNMRGVIRDVLKGETRKVVAEDYMTKTTKVAPDDKQPKLWLKFLGDCTGNDKELIAYLQRMCGYFLTGSTKEDALFFLYGPGKNGKSVFIDTISGIMGDYATGLPMEALLASKSDRHPTELAKLMGARLAVAVETEQGRRWDESKVKTLTGGDKITARFMRQDFFDFVPTHKLLIAGNNKPHLSGKVDEAWRRRFHIIPFTRVVDEAKRDRDLRIKLQEEWPSILQWMIEGAQKWLEQGLNPPEAVTKETNSYLDQEDVIGRWLDDRCEKRPDGFEPTETLFANWRGWCEQTGEYPGKQRDFALELAAKGYEQDRRHVLGVKYRGFAGITLAATWTGKQ